MHHDGFPQIYHLILEFRVLQLQHLNLAVGPHLPLQQLAQPQLLDRSVQLQPLYSLLQPLHLLLLIILLRLPCLFLERDGDAGSYVSFLCRPCLEHSDDWLGLTPSAITH